MPKNYSIEDVETLRAKAGVSYEEAVSLLDKYDGDMGMALTAYNRGAYGAQRDLFSKGIYESEYSRKVLEEAQRLTEGAITNVRH